MRHDAESLILLTVVAALAACSGAPRDKAADEPVSAAATATAAAASPAVAAEAPAAPPAAFAQCMSCHSVEPGRNGIGPTLAGIYGSKAGAVPGFAFSPALQQSGITWDRATLDQWLAGPMQLVPGTRMVMPVTDPVRRKEIVDYLETLK